MHVATFIGELQHYKNFKPSYLSIGKWAIRPLLSDQVTNNKKNMYESNLINVAWNSKTAPKTILAQTPVK